MAQSVVDVLFFDFEGVNSSRSFGYGAQIRAVSRAGSVLIIRIKAMFDSLLGTVVIIRVQHLVSRSMSTGMHSRLEFSHPFYVYSRRNEIYFQG